MRANGKDSPTPQSRRQFIQRSSAAVAAAAVSTWVKPVHAAGDDAIKLALVGCGNRGTGAVANALGTSAPVKLWAMADAFRDRLDGSLNVLAGGGKLRGGGVPAEVAARVDVSPERQFVGLDAYKHAIDAADVVLLCAPPGFRPEQFGYAVKNGKHVFMEKPVATDAPGVRRVLAAGKLADEKGLKVGVGLQRHHDAKYLETIGRLRDGAIGPIRMLRCYWNGGTIKRPVEHGSLTEMQYQVRNWYFFHWLSGDHIVEQHVHNLDVCNWVMDAHPVSAVGMGGRLMRTGKDYGDIFDHHAVEYTYPDGTRMFGFCRQMPGCDPMVGEFAVGTRGEADISKAVLESTDGRWRYPRKGKRGRYAAENPYQIEHETLLAAVRNGAPYNEAETGATATMTAILGRTATYTGTTVSWDKAFGSEHSLAPAEITGWDTMPLTKPDAEGLYPLPKPGIIKVV